MGNTSSGVLKQLNEKEKKASSRGLVALTDEEKVQLGDEVSSKVSVALAYLNILNLLSIQTRAACIQAREYAEPLPLVFAELYTNGILNNENIAAVVESKQQAENMSKVLVQLDKNKNLSDTTRKEAIRLVIENQLPVSDIVSAISQDPRLRSKTSNTKGSLAKLSAVASERDRPGSVEEKVKSYDKTKGHRVK